MGSFVVSLANPFAAGSRDGSPSASKGIVSKLGRAAMASSQEYPDERYSKPLYLLNTLITTDMNLNTGCSGGALLNLRGEMVGLTTARAAVAGSDKAGGFAIPINRAMRRIIDKLRAGLEVEYGFLGVNRDRQGTRVISGVVPGSPADHAGLRLGESIVSIDGVPIRDADDIYLTIATLLAGSTARIELAGNPPRSVSVTATSGRVAPAESVARPVTVPVMFWASEAIDSDRAMIKTGISPATSLRTNFVAQAVKPVLSCFECQKRQRQHRLDSLYY